MRHDHTLEPVNTTVGRFLSRTAQLTFAVALDPAGARHVPVLDDHHVPVVAPQSTRYSRLAAGIVYPVAVHV